MKGIKKNERNEIEVCEVDSSVWVPEEQQVNAITYIANSELLQFHCNSYGSGSGPEKPG